GVRRRRGRRCRLGAGARRLGGDLPGGRGAGATAGGVAAVLRRVRRARRRRRVRHLGPPGRGGAPRRLRAAARGRARAPAAGRRDGRVRRGGRPRARGEPRAGRPPRGDRAAGPRRVGRPPPPHRTRRHPVPRRILRGARHAARGGGYGRYVGRVSGSLPSLDGTVALVTGASGGIGSCVARRFAEAGAAVVVHHRTGAERAAAVVEEITSAGGRAVAAQADVTDREAVQGLVELAVERFGRLDSVVAAAGVQPVARLAGMPVEAWRAVLHGNATGAFATVQAAAGVLRGRGGSITLIASVEGSRPARGHAHYAAAKAATIMLARAAA